MKDDDPKPVANVPETPGDGDDVVHGTVQAV